MARSLAVEVLEQAIDLEHKRDRRLAQYIIEELAKAMNR